MSQITRDKLCEIAIEGMLHTESEKIIQNPQARPMIKFFSDLWQSGLLNELGFYIEKFAKDPMTENVALTSAIPTFLSRLGSNPVKSKLEAWLNSEIDARKKGTRIPREEDELIRTHGGKKYKKTRKQKRTRKRTRKRTNKRRYR